jgi:hypothetical protein
MPEKLSMPVLRLEISDSTFVTPPSTSLLGDDPSPSFRQRVRIPSNAGLTSRRSSQGNISSTTTPLPSPQVSLPVPPGISKARDESQKLLAHVLEQLRHRPECPSSYSLPFQAAPAAKSTIPRPSVSRTTSEIQSLDPEYEETSERAFSPDLAYDLMNRLRDVLMISLSHGWQIFNERSVFGRSSQCNVLMITPPAVHLRLSSEVAKNRTLRPRLLLSADEGAVQALTQGACQLLGLNQPSCFPSAFPFSSPLSQRIVGSH